MSELQPWQVCTGLMCWPLFFAGLYVLYQAVTSDAVSTPRRRNVSSLEHVENHSEMDARRVAVALEANIIGNRGQQLDGELHIYADDPDVTKLYGDYAAQHGHECGNNVTVIRHNESRP